MKRVSHTQDPIWKTYVEQDKEPGDADEKTGEDDHKDKDLEHN